MDQRKGKATFPEMNESNIEASSEGKCTEGLYSADIKGERF